MTSTTARTDMPSLAAIFSLAWPLALKAMMLHGIIVIDAWLVSALGEPALAAMGLAASIGGLLLGFLFAFSNATQIRIAQAFGTGSDVALKTGFYVGLTINVVTAGVGILLLVLFGGRLIDTFAHTPDIAVQAKNYLIVFLGVVFFEAFGQCLGSFFNGCGRTKTPFLSYLIAIPVNIAVSYTLIHGLFGLPALGVTGAAVGSMFAAMIRMIFLGTGFIRLNGAFRNVPGWKNDTMRASIRRHLVFALPIAGTFISMTLANNVSMLLYAKMSVNEFAAITLIQPWVLMIGQTSTAWGMATGIMVAQLLGSDQRGPDLDAFLLRAWRGAAAAACVVSAAYVGLSLSAPRMYDSLEAETMIALMSFLPILLLMPFPRGSNLMCGQTLRASGDTLYPMNVHVAAQWLFRVPLTAVFILYLGLSVTWVFALVLVEEFLKFPFFHKRILKGTWKQGRVAD